MASAAPQGAVGSNQDDNRPVTARMIVVGFMLALSNFVVTLDMTIANVSVPHIAGGMAVAVSSGTWVITSYAVAEAICVPLSGWLIGRFGAFRVLFVSIIGFGIFSALCGLATSLTALVIFRIGQGFCGGPLMPLSQTLLMRVFPPRVRGKAMSFWTLTIVVAPIAGPILGGLISDNMSWRWIFFINVPVVIVIFTVLRITLGNRDTERVKLPIDKVGLALLILWVGCFQLMLDLGRDHDWFHSTTIVMLGCVALVGFMVFIIWELGERHPVVNLKVFRYRGFSAAAVALTLAFGTYLSSVVIIPQFLQTTVGYTATQAGYVSAFAGALAIVGAWTTPALMERFDPRLVVFTGLLWVAFCSLLRARWTVDGTFWDYATPQMIQGIGTTMMMVPLTMMSLNSVKPQEVPAAASIIGFMRTISNAVGTASIMSAWDNYGREKGVELAGALNAPQQAIDQLHGAGLSYEAARAVLAQMVQQQAAALGTNETFLLSALLLVTASATVWLIPKPARGKPAADVGVH